MGNSINYKTYPPVIRYMGNEYIGGPITDSGVVEITQTEYDALPSEEKLNGKVYIVTPDVSTYTFVESQDKTCVVRINNATGERLWFFCGFTKGSSDVAPPTELAQYAPSVLCMTSNYPQGGVNQDGWIGFYLGNIRSWTQDTSQVTSGTFYGVYDLDGGVFPIQQINPYFDPYEITEPFFYYMGEKYIKDN